MARNHYIPRLQLRTFAENGKIHLFNVELQQFDTRKVKNTFCEDDLFPDKLEEKFAKEIEGPFGDLLHHKLLSSADEIVINRQENMLIRKFELLQRLRSVYTNQSYEEMMSQAKETDNPNLKKQAQKYQLFYVFRK